MRRRTLAGQEVGIDLLLAGSDAFRYLAEELAADYARRHDAGDRPEALECLKRMAELAGWWCGRLEAEADYLAGFGPERGMNGSAPTSVDSRSGISTDPGNHPCRRRRRRGT